LTCSVVLKLLRKEMIA